MATNMKQQICRFCHMRRTGPFAPTRILQLMCYSVLAVNGYNPQLTRLFISPSYFHYQARTLALCVHNVMEPSGSCHSQGADDTCMSGLAVRSPQDLHSSSWVLLATS